MYCPTRVNAAPRSISPESTSPSKSPIYIKLFPSSPTFHNPFDAHRLASLDCLPQVHAQHRNEVDLKDTLAWDAFPDLTASDLVHYTSLGKSVGARSIDSYGTHESISSVGSLFSSIKAESVESQFAAPQTRCASPLEFDAFVDRQGGKLYCLGPQCQQIFEAESEYQAHVTAVHSHTCKWANCRHLGLSTPDELKWHVMTEHLLICPVTACGESAFRDSRMLLSHIKVTHPEVTQQHSHAWRLPSKKHNLSAEMNRTTSTHSVQTVRGISPPPTQTRTPQKAPDVVARYKRKCKDDLRAVAEKKSRRQGGKRCATPEFWRGFRGGLFAMIRKGVGVLTFTIAVGSGGAVRSSMDRLSVRTPRLNDVPSFPVVFEHAILPFLIEFMPKWSGPKHVISVTKGRKPQTRRICIMTRAGLSRARKMTVAAHVVDLLPEQFRGSVSFVFSTGQVNRMTWARGLGRQHKDEICIPRNPYHFPIPCMGDSIGIPEGQGYRQSTATLGPCLSIGGGKYWLANFHPFETAYKSGHTVTVEHPSPQDRSRCTEEGHDVLASDAEFQLGDLQVTSGINLETTRISHDPYWEDCGKEKPLIVTDWALISSRVHQANMLRQFPQGTANVVDDKVINTTSPVIPGAPVISSGRTSGYQAGQICEIPAYVSGDENGTQKATREWFVEEPELADDEESWIRGGIGVEGDSGAAIVDAETNDLIGQLWGRNRYWGPGPRHTFFTPIADIFDDIQEKCGQQTRPQLPLVRDEADCFPVYPSCRRCYDLRVYLDSRRSSRMSIQSMIIGLPDTEQDLASLYPESELDTPRDYQRLTGVEEVGAGFVLPSYPVPIMAASPMGESTSTQCDNLVDDLNDMLSSAASERRDGKRSREMPELFAVSNDDSQRVKKSRTCT